MASATATVGVVDGAEASIQLLATMVWVRVQVERHLILRALYRVTSVVKLNAKFSKGGGA